jgi:hypothetical protein
MGFEATPEYEEIALDMATLYGKGGIAHKIRQPWTSNYCF